MNGKILAIFAAPDSKMTMFRKCEPQSFRNWISAKKQNKKKNMSNECKKIDDQNIKNGTSFVEDLRARIVAYFRQNFQTIYNSLFCRASKLHLL